MPARDPPDPLDAALRPPIDETPEEKIVRLAQEAEARRVSHQIDEDIKRERTFRKKRQVVKLLLLGQSESGESRFALLPSPLSRPAPRLRTPRPKHNATTSLELHITSLKRSVPARDGADV